MSKTEEEITEKRGCDGMRTRGHSTMLIHTAGLMGLIAVVALLVYQSAAAPSALGATGDIDSRADTLSFPVGVVYDSAGDLYFSERSACRVSKLSVNTGTLTPVVGTGVCGYSGDGGPATSAQLNAPTGLALDPQGDLAITDTENCRVRKLDLETNVITTVAGNGTCGFSGDGGPATEASLALSDVETVNSPVVWSDVAFDADGNLYIGDNFNCRVRRVNPDGIISTVAGSGPTGFFNCAFGGDDGLATEALVGEPVGVGLDTDGDLFIAESLNCRVRRVDGDSGIISTVAGTGLCVSTGDGGPALSAGLSYPRGLALDTAGDIYVSEFRFEGASRTDCKVRRVDVTTGFIDTIAGTGTCGYSGDGGPAVSAELDAPADISISRNGNVAFTQPFNGRIREVEGIGPQEPTPTPTPCLPEGCPSPTNTPQPTETPAAPLRLGVLVPLTGALSTFGPDYLRAAQLAANEINAAGGVNGGQVVIVSGDTGTAPEQGVTEAERLVSVEGVAAIIGAASSGVSLAVAETVTIPNGILQISPASTSPALTNVEDSDFLFRMPISDDAQALVLAEVVIEDLGLSSVCDLHVNNAYGQGLAETFAEHFADLGGTVKASVPHDDSEAVSYLAELTECTTGNPEALIAMSYPTGQATVYLREAIEGDLIDNFVFVDGTREDDIFNELGWEPFDGMLGTFPGALETTFGDAFDVAYQAEYGALYLTPFVRETYDAVVAIALGAAAAGTNTNAVAIRDSLRDSSNAPGTVYGPGQDNIGAALAAVAAADDIDYQGASGPVDFDDNGDITFGAIDVWQVDACSESFFTVRRVRVDLRVNETEIAEEFTASPGIVGDVNRDSMVSSIDASFVLQFSAGLTALPCSEAGDANGDGSVNSLDAVLILQFTAGLLDSLPV